MYFGKLKWLGDVNPPEVFFIIRLHRHGTITWEEKDIEMAKFYGIPTCCRDFYVDLRRVGITPAQFMLTTFGTDTESAYIRCLKCRKEVT